MSAKKEQEFIGKSADFTSDHVDLQVFTSFSVQVNVSNGSGFDGFVTLQVSNDFDNWVDVTSTTLALTGASDVQFYDVVQSAASFARVSFIITTGSADFNIDWMLKP